MIGVVYALCEPDGEIRCALGLIVLAVGAVETAAYLLFGPIVLAVLVGLALLGIAIFAWGRSAA